MCGGTAGEQADHTRGCRAPAEPAKSRRSREIGLLTCWGLSRGMHIGAPEGRADGSVFPAPCRVIPSNYLE